MANSTDTNIPLTKLSPFKLAKAISDAANGKLNNVTALPNNFILLDYNNADQSEKLQSTQFLDNINVNITPHKSFNFCKGVIRYKDLHMCTEEEIVAELFNQGCRRITIKKNDQIIETSTYVLTFNKLQLPKTINAGYQLLRVEKYIPPPLRCNNYQRYGHHSTKCRISKPTCPRCAGEHKFDNCPQEAFKCANCKDSHVSSSKTCPKWKQEQEIIKLKYDLNITFPEARKKILLKNTSISYGTVAAKTYKTVETQTEPFTFNANISTNIPFTNQNNAPTSTQTPSAALPPPFIHSFIHQGRRLAVGSFLTCLSAYRKR